MTHKTPAEWSKVQAAMVTAGSVAQATNVLQMALDDIAVLAGIIERYAVKYDPDYPTFGMIGEPRDHKQHPNQQAGLDRYVRVVNLGTGEVCFKKLYRNGRGLHFKHTGYSPMYLADFTASTEVVPFQVLFDGLPNPRSTRMTENAEQMTNAEFARRLATLQQIVLREMRDHVQGMWNPLYCSADANAGYVLQEIRDWLEYAEKRASLSPTKD